VVLATSTPPSANAPSVAVIRVSCMGPSSGRDAFNVRRGPIGRQDQPHGDDPSGCSALARPPAMPSARSFVHRQPQVA
jgi:hypothetical protein